jgi:hypothetical protein
LSLTRDRPIQLEKLMTDDEKWERLEEAERKLKAAERRFDAAIPEAVAAGEITVALH